MSDMETWLYDHGYTSGHSDPFGLTHLTWQSKGGGLYPVYVANGDTPEEASAEMFEKIKGTLYERCE